MTAVVYMLLLLATTGQGVSTIFVILVQVLILRSLWHPVVGSILQHYAQSCYDINRPSQWRWCQQHTNTHS